jgi:hypothetical protein
MSAADHSRLGNNVTSGVVGVMSNLGGGRGDGGGANGVREPLGTSATTGGRRGLTCR